MTEVCNTEFYRVIGALNVHPRLEGEYPYTSHFETPGRVRRGVIVGFWVKPGVPGARYYLTNDIVPR